MEILKLILSFFGLLYTLDGLPVILSKPIRASSRFTYLGRFSNNLKNLHEDYREKRSSGSSGNQESFYFKSQNAAGWSTASKDCKAFLDHTATLLYIETQEELDQINRYLESSDDTGSMYWIGGTFDPVRDTFIWGENGTKFESWVPWKDGHPNTRVPVTRVAALTVGAVKFVTKLNTESERFICELKSSTVEIKPKPQHA